ncbi:MAG: cytochrome c [Hyphomicrobiales bacterium]
MPRHPEARGAGRRLAVAGGLCAGAMLMTAMAVTAPASAVASAEEIAPERARQLTEFVRQDCGSCHGMTLKGGLGRPLSPDMLEGRDAEVIAEIILEGIPGTAMPPWRGLLTEAEVAWIASALKDGRIK